MNLQIILTILFHTSVQSMDIQTAVVRNLTDSLVHVDSRFNEPVIKHSTGLMTTVDLRVELRNLIDFDVSKGTLTLFTTFEWSWTDKSLSWDTSEFNQNFIRLPVNKVWFPLVYIENTASGTDALSVAESLQVDFSGLVLYYTPQVLHLLCNPDVSKFPFDVHICAINVAPLLNNGGFNMQSSTTKGLDLSGFWQNSAWNVTAVNVTNKAGRYVEYYIRLKRHAFFLMLNLIAPILLLGIMNLFVFVLPQESGRADVLQHHHSAFICCVHLICIPGATRRQHISVYLQRFSWWFNWLRVPS